MGSKFYQTMVFAAAGIALSAGSVAALPMGNELQDELNVRTYGGVSGVNVQSDMVKNDSQWRFTAATSSAITLMFENSGAAQNLSFGIASSSNPGVRLELFSGDEDPGTPDAQQTVTYWPPTNEVFPGKPGADVSADIGEDPFIWYIETPDETFFSDPLLNPEEMDFMLTYAGNNEDMLDTLGVGYYGLWTEDAYILAWEDLYDGDDFDHTDFVVMVSSVTPTATTPEPATMFLFGVGLVGLAGVSRRRKKLS